VVGWHALLLWQHIGSRSVAAWRASSHHRVTQACCADGRGWNAPAACPALLPTERMHKAARAGAGRSPFRHLIYPLPEHGGLGVHLTLDLAGAAKFGPDVQWVGGEEYAVDPARADSFYPAIRTYFPGLPDGALAPAYSGARRCQSVLTDCLAAPQSVVRTGRTPRAAYTFLRVASL
jgi:hypothetical protein